MERRPITALVLLTCLGAGGCQGVLHRVAPNWFGPVEGPAAPGAERQTASAGAAMGEETAESESAAPSDDASTAEAADSADGGATSDSAGGDESDAAAAAAAAADDDAADNDAPDADQADGDADSADGASGAAATDVTDASGLTTRELEVGDGPLVTPDSFVTVTYTADIVGDRTIEEVSEPAGPWPVDALIPGLARGLEGMAAGGRRVITIPPALGYGDEPITDPSTGAVRIPAGSTLRYDIRVISVEDAPATTPGSPSS